MSLGPIKGPKLPDASQVAKQAASAAIGKVPLPGAIAKGVQIAHKVESAMGAVGALAKLPGLAAGLFEKLLGGGRGQIAAEIATGDDLDVRQFSVHERMSSLFAVNLVAHSPNSDIDFDEVIGQEATFAVLSPLHGRAWKGICTSIRLVGAERKGLSTYALTITPRLWFATQRRNYRIFQQTTELDIARKLLKEWGVDVIEKLEGKYKERKYRVQYAESDYAFLCRMLEDAGVSFYFSPDDAGERLVITDRPQNAAPREPPLPYQENMMVAAMEHVSGVRVGQRVRPARYTVRDQDYRLDPTFPNFASAESTEHAVEAPLERFHYVPGAFLYRADKGDSTPIADDRGKTRSDETEAKALAQRRLDAKRASGKVLMFSTNAHDVAPGTILHVHGHAKAESAGKKGWLVLETSFSGTSDGEWHLESEAVSAAHAYHPPLVTPKPRVLGVESATVTGPKGEEIHCDEFGRVRVHFQWDRESKLDEKSSCWIHASQSWAGAAYGAMNLPRVGQEVLVDFLGGDPDRPIIVGRVYTNLQRVPYKLPLHKTQSGWKSNSTGKSGGYNEIMFEDKGGSELIRVHAQKDRVEVVQNNASQSVGNDRAAVVGNEDIVFVGAKHTRTIGAPQAASKTLMRMINESIDVETAIGQIHINEKGIQLHSSTDIVIQADQNVHIFGAKVYVNCDKEDVTALPEASGASKVFTIMQGVGMVALAIPGLQGVGLALIGVSIIGSAVAG